MKIMINSTNTISKCTLKYYFRIKHCITEESSSSHEVNMSYNVTGERMIAIFIFTQHITSHINHLKMYITYNTYTQCNM